ncbi:flippase-like domain-containing protein [Candidatus Saccharibacteria bacterium]|nr:flippase-like domain-containing protein [Candidatus Saccharibacteria bacterium]
MSFRRWVSIISFAAIIILLVASWKDILHAWRLLEQVNLLILSLLIPLQFASYYASGEILASFLRSKGELKDVSRMEVARFSLEFNFVNHILPTGGLSGASYANWRFKHMGVPVARVTLANLLRFLVTFGVFIIFLFIAVFILALDGNVNRVTLVFASTLSTLIIAGSFFLVFVVSSLPRLRGCGSWFTRTVNGLTRRLLRRSRPVVSEERVHHFLGLMHQDYVEVRKSPAQLQAPFMWAVIFTLLEVSMFLVTFASLQTFVNPAAVLIAYGFAGFAAVFVATPGGAGAYEAVMISFLSGAGIPQGTAIAGVLLTRVILIVVTIVSGYIFYQLALMKYGKGRQLTEVKPPAS